MKLQHILQAVVCAVIATVCIASAECFPIQSASAHEQDRQIYKPGLRNGFLGRPLSAKEQELVLAQLRQKTGFERMRFDEAGFLTIDDRSLVVGGSALARELLLAAVDGKKSINLQSHNRSPQVAFARVGDNVEFSAWRLNTKITATPVEIDFDDFAHLRGHREAMEAFDPGFVILHELCHAALGLRDPSADVYATGDCESYVNRIRRELGLPERQQYAASGSWQKLSPASPTVVVAELVFAQPGSESGAKPRKLYLRWEAQPVGDIRRLPSQSKGKRRKNANVALAESGLQEESWNSKH